MTFPNAVQLAANIATVLALLGIGLAYWQFREGVKAERQASAVATWNEYLRLALQHPNHARPTQWVTGQGASDPNFDEYRWFVAAVLFACEQVLDAHPSDKAWEEIVQAQLKYHRGFLGLPQFDPDVYSPALRRLAKGVVANGPLAPF